MNAIVVAGGEVLPKESLYEITRGGLKGMLPVNGKPMVQWVLDALSAAKRVERVVVVGLPQETLLDYARSITVLEDQGSLSDNILAGAQELARSDKDSHALLFAADIPAVRPEMIDWLVCQAQDGDSDVYYTLIERATMESVFPKSKHPYIHLKGMEVCGGDCHCVRLSFLIEENLSWKRLFDARKGSLRQASLLGFDTLFVLLLRRLGLKEAETKISQRLGVKVRAVLSPFPELGMDIDKPSQLEILNEYLTRPADDGDNQGVDDDDCVPVESLDPQNPKD
jgi:molybdopterin-guanine dinucleotide biosynthesis protein A